MISSGVWRLSRANALCLIRRLQPEARANPLLASLAILAPVALLIGLAWTGSREPGTIATCASPRMTSTSSMDVVTAVPRIVFPSEPLNDGKA